MGGRCSLLILGSKGPRSSALDIEVEIWLQDSRVTPYHTYGLSWDLRYLRFYQAQVSKTSYPFRKELIYTYYM
jgi:hypothetical protein